MKKLLIIIGTISLLVSVSLSGCNQVNITSNPEKNKFVGTWANTTRMMSWSNATYTETFTLLSDGTSSYMGLAGTWDIKDHQLVITDTRDSIVNYYTYVFSNNDRTLTLNGNQVFTKQ
ncbi:MAG TPA: hypothetical protein VMT57_03900 [Candidatus Thermoplasmatota archaeon]|nr:hypothetical protein [Candidatus Thermoplasmatota archaeon]